MVACTIAPRYIEHNGTRIVRERRHNCECFANYFGDGVFANMHIEWSFAHRNFIEMR